MQDSFCSSYPVEMQDTGHTPAPDSTMRNVPWGLWDALVIAMVFFFAPCLLLTLILFLPQGHLFFLPDADNEPAIIWSSPKPYSSPPQSASDTNEICQAELTLDFAEGTPRSPNRLSDSSDAKNHDAAADKTSSGTQVESPQNTKQNQTDACLADTNDDLQTEHPLTQLLVQAKGTSRYWWAVLFAFLAGVVAAPIVEEFLFRVVLQGALERKPDHEVSTEAAQRKRTVIAILIPAFFFAAIHYRTPGTQQDLDLLFLSMLITPFGLMATLLFALLWLKVLHGASRRDLGIVWKEVPTDFLKGFAAFFLLVPILVPVVYQVRLLFPDAVTDPIPIFILALGLGILYHKTRRYASVVGMHFALNFFSFVLLLLR